MGKQPYQLNQKAREIRPYTPDLPEGGDWIHLDANESFLQPPEDAWGEMLGALAELPLNRYPDPAAGAVCRAFGEHYGVDPALVTAGNGSDELISVLFTAFLEKGDVFATAEPDFSMYAFYGQLCEGRHLPIEKKNFRLDVDNVIETCENEGVKLLIFSNPCNPTSLGLVKAEVIRLIQGVSGLVVLDEAYMDFWSESLLAQVSSFDNLVILRTCSKALGGAGLRLGFAAANPRLTEVIRGAKSPYNVNGLTQALGKALLTYPAQGALETLRTAKETLEAGLLALATGGAFRVLRGQTNFVSLAMPHPRDFYEALRREKILVRLTGGLIRITAGTAEENQAVLAAARRYFCGAV